MCYSVKTSIIAYTVGMMSALVAIKTGNLPLGFLILFYCQIQLAEGIIWRGIDTNNLQLNQLGTTIAKYALALQLFGFGIGLYLAYGYIHPLAIGAIFFIIVCVIYAKNPHPSHTFPFTTCQKRECQNHNNRLVWEFPVEWYAVMAILILGMYMIYVKDSLLSRSIVFIFFSATWLLSKYVVPPAIASSSIWCFFSAIAAPVLVVLSAIY